MVNVIAIIIGTYVAMVTGLFVFQRSLIYHPTVEPPSVVRAGVPEMKSVTIRTVDGLDLLSWYAAAAPGRPTIVHYHGNAGNIGHRGHRIRPFLDAGWGVMLVEYRGFGGNPGSPTEDGLFRDGLAALAFLDAEGVPAKDRILYGESLGTAVAVAMAQRLAEMGTPVGAVVLEAPFTSIADVAAYHYPFVPARHLVRDRFDSRSRIPDIDSPLLIVHGEADRTVPIRFGKALAAAAVAPKTVHWVAGAGHNNLQEFGIAGHVMRFAMEAGLTAGSAIPSGAATPPSR